MSLFFRFRILLKLKSMQKPETGTTRAQIPPSKPKREITKITNSQNTIRAYGQPSEQLFPKRWPLSNPNCFHTKFLIGTCQSSVRCSRSMFLLDFVFIYLKMHISRVVRKPAFCTCENKAADQLYGKRTADQRLCIRYTDSTYNPSSS